MRIGLIAEPWWVNLLLLVPPVAYLRAATGLLPGYQGTLADVIRRSGEFYQQSQAINQFPQSLLTLEVFRETATILMLLSVALLTTAKASSRAAVFLWTFAIWDITYYAALWATVRWPLSQIGRAHV